MTDSRPRLRIKDLAEEDKPREKLLKRGIDSLSTAELLAVLIGSGNHKETSVELCQRILKSADNNLINLGKFTVKQLISEFYGIGEAKAISIIAAMELGKRRNSTNILIRKQICCSLDIYEYFHPMLCDLHFEEFWILLLDRSNKIIEKVKISRGGISETIVDSRLILKEALLHLASGIILCHNHPSGNTKPSNADDIITMKIKEGAGLLDLVVLDHVIICDGSYYSYADEGRV